MTITDVYGRLFFCYKHSTTTTSKCKYHDGPFHRNVIFTQSYDLLWEYQGYKLIKHYTLYIKLMVTHSSFHIWFVFSCTPQIKVVRAVFTQTTRSIFSSGTFSLNCAIFVVEFRWLGKNICNYLTIRRSRKTKPDLKTTMNNHQFGIQFVVFSVNL